MPSITDFKNIKKTNKIFKKKEYRPWSKETEVTTSNLVKNSKNTESSLPKKQKAKTIKTLDTSNHNEELEKIWRCLYGAKKIILEIILNNIEETHDQYLITSSITTSQLTLESSLPENTIKTSIQQLKKEGVLSNHETKPGRGGFARYKIPQNIYKYFITKFSSNT